MFTVVSPAFGDGGHIPLEFISPRGGGQGHSIPLAWSGAPTGTASFAVTIVDHAPVARMWVHWAVTGIPPTVDALPTGASGTDRMPDGSREYVNTGGAAGYGGPNPPAGSGEHPYVVTVYALNVAHLELPPQPSAEDIDRALQRKVLGTAQLTGMYAK